MGKTIVGRIFGRLRVLGRDRERSSSKRTYLRCLCRCGGIASVYRSNLLAGTTRSCGCLALEVSTAVHTTHGYSAMPEYGIWVNIRHRCLNPSSSTYGAYGARGIGMSSKWASSFTAFLADMGPRPSDSHQVERKNNNKGYYKGNCVWATCKTQARNRRSTRLIEYRGRVQCLLDWAIEFGMRRETLTYRLNRGWSVGDALNKPIR